MRRVKFKTNVDRLKLKCSGGDWLFCELGSGLPYVFNGGRVEPLSLECYHGTDEPKKINADVYIMDVDYPILHLCIELRHLTTVKVYNRVFYSENIDMIIPILDELQLHIEGIERMELCIDANVSILARLRAMIRDINGYDMIVNGAKVDDDEACLTLMSGLSRKRMAKNPTICRQNTSGFDLKVYDKKTEIAESEKDYILAYNGMEGGVMHRVEIGLSGFHLNQSWTDPYELLYYVLLEPHRYELILEYCNRILRFNDKESSKKKKANTISILDLIY